MIDHSSNNWTNSRLIFLKKDISKSVGSRGFGPTNIFNHLPYFQITREMAEVGIVLIFHKLGDEILLGTIFSWILHM